MTKKKRVSTSVKEFKKAVEKVVEKWLLQGRSEIGYTVKCCGERNLLVTLGSMPKVRGGERSFSDPLTDIQKKEIRDFLAKIADMVHGLVLVASHLMSCGSKMCCNLELRPTQ